MSRSSNKAKSDISSPAKVIETDPNQPQDIDSVLSDLVRRYFNQKELLPVGMQYIIDNQRCTLIYSNGIDKAVFSRGNGSLSICLPDNLEQFLIDSKDHLNELDNIEKPSSSVLSAKEHWNTLKKLFVSTDEKGKKVFGLALKERFWFEFNDPAHPDGDEFDMSFWRERKTKLPCRVWYTKAGLSAKLSDDKAAYYDSEERKDFIIYFDDGLLKDGKNVLIDTTSCYMGLGACVLSLDGKLYCYENSFAQTKERMTSYHSGILSGAPVAFAGEIGVKQGVIEKITIRSGHYQPSERHLIRFLKKLKYHGVDLSRIELLDHSSDDKIASNAEIYLTQNTLFKPYVNKHGFVKDVAAQKENLEKSSLQYATRNVQTNFFTPVAADTSEEIKRKNDVQHQHSSKTNLSSSDGKQENRRIRNRFANSLFGHQVTDNTSSIVLHGLVKSFGGF